MQKGQGFGFLGGLLIGAVMLGILGAALYWFRSTTPVSEESLHALIDKLNLINNPGASYAIPLALEDKGSAFLFFNKDAKSLISLDNGVERIFERPSRCSDKGCVCNCMKYTEKTSGNTRVVTCSEKTTCIDQNRRFFDPLHYEKNAPRNDGHVIHNFGGGPSQANLQIEPFQQKILVLCQTEAMMSQTTSQPSKDCITSDLRHLLTFDLILNNNLNSCLTDPLSCDLAKQDINRIVDADYNLEFQPGTQTAKVVLKKKTEEKWNFELKTSVCLTEKPEEQPTEQKPFAIQWDASLGVIVGDKGVLERLTAYKDKICMLYVPQELASSS